MTFKKKKIRGWKRRKRAIENWKQRNLILDKDLLIDDSRDYVKIWIAPFYTLDEYDLPYWYKQLLLDALIEIYHSWQTEIDSLNRKYYLKIWLFEKNFMRSQVVVAIDDFLHFYDNSFGYLMNVKKLPVELRTKKSGMFSWSQGSIVTILTELELTSYYSQKEISQLKKSAYLTKDDTYFIKEEIVWIN